MVFIAGASKICYMCGSLTGFYIWSTSRNFPRNKMMIIKDVKDKFTRNKICVDGETVCFQCFNELLERD